MGGVALPPMATPSHEKDLDTLGARCRAVFSRLGVSPPTPRAAGPFAQLSHGGVFEVTFSGEQNPALGLTWWGELAVSAG